LGGAVAILLAVAVALVSHSCSKKPEPGPPPSEPSTNPPAGPPTAAMPQRYLTPPNYVFDPDFPRDAVTQDLGAIGLQPFVNNLGWYTFIALNWPVPDVLTQRGVPDRQNVVGGLVQQGEGGPTISPTGPVVWESYKDTADIFLNPPVRPLPFDAPEIIPPACQVLAAADAVAARRTLVTAAKISDVLRDYKEAFSDAPLVDQNGNKVWYEVKVNRAYYDYVVNNGFYNSNNQKGKVISFPSSSNTTGTEPAIKVKAAWKIMGGSGSKQPDDPKKFYTTQALILDPDTGVCTKQLVGLVGLHIVMKTQQLPQWSWATFEQVDNAPDQQGGPTPGKKYNFFSSSCAGCPFNKPNKDPKNTFPTQVVRLVPVSSESPNAIFQTALQSLRADNVWTNYMMVNAQWSGTATPVGVPSQPQYLANTTLETYFQQPVDDKIAPHGCINCHGKYAGTTDLDFQIQKAYPHAATIARENLAAHGVTLPVQ
jgi:hypothetical protein